MHISKRITLGTVSLLSFSLALVIMGALTQQADREGSSAQLQAASSSIPVKRRGTSYRPALPAQTYTTQGVPGVCGNGNVEPGEECDDRYNNGFGRCSKDCKIQYCGDGILTPGLGEECEAQLRTYLDPDTNQQYEELGFDTRSCGGIVCSAPDPAKGIAGCKRQFLPACNAASTGTPTSSTAMVPSPPDASESVPVSSVAVGGANCGNGIRDAGEQCDTGPKNSDTAPNSCRADCSLPRCGDGVVDAYLQEQCDDGARNSNQSDQCRSNCTLPRCGDGIVDSGEQCDRTEGCTSTCTLLDHPSSASFVDANNSSALGMSLMSARCGNGIVEDGEQCDGGPQCTVDCQLFYAAAPISGESSASFSSETVANNAPALAPVCGNGRVEPPEQCDDANTVTGDGCSALCLLETSGATPAQASAVDGSLFVVFTVMSLLGFITGASVGLLARRGAN